MRMAMTLFLAFSLLPSLGAAETLYKWIDAQGNVHYSDKPGPGATKIVVPRAPTFTPPQVAVPAAGANENREGPAATGYNSISIVSPKDQDTLWNTPSVTVSVSVDPALRPGDKVTISLDGVSQTVSGTSATFSEIDRGQHTVTATVTGREGGSATAQAVTFYLQKTSVKKPP